MTASTRTFGIEIECYLPESFVRQNNLIIGGYHHGVQVNGLPRGWNAQRDGSLTAPRGKVPVEIVSPILSGVEGLQQVVTVLEWLRNAGAGCNESCGIHVHVGSDKKTATFALAMTAQHEKALFAVCGKKGKWRVQNRFCQKVSGDETIRNEYERTKTSKEPALRYSASNRYQTINLTNLWNNRCLAVEFRAFAATFVTASVLGYIRLCLGIVEYCAGCKTPVKFESAKVNHAASGQDQLKALLSKLRWGKTTGFCNYGWVDCDRWDAKRTVKHLQEMAIEFERSILINN